MTHGRQELASDLRGLIARAELTPAEVSRRINVSESTVSRYLAGQVSVSPAAVRRIVYACDAAGTEEAQQILNLAEDVRAGSASRVVILRSGSGTNQRRFRALEAAAARVSTFTTVIVPGLLQTERYMRALYVAQGGSSDNLEKWVNDRRKRQSAMATSSTEYVQVLSEAALRWQLESSALMLEQTRHVAAVLENLTGPRVRVGLIPWTAPVGVLPLTSFDLYDDRHVVVGSSFGTAFMDRPRDVAVYVEQFAQLEALAVFGADALPHLERIAAEYDAHGG